MPDSILIALSCLLFLLAAFLAAYIRFKKKQRHGQRRGRRRTKRRRRRAFLCRRGTKVRAIAPTTSEEAPALPASVASVVEAPAATTQLGTVLRSGPRPSETAACILCSKAHLVFAGQSPLRHSTRTSDMGHLLAGATAFDLDRLVVDDDSWPSKPRTTTANPHVCNLQSSHQVAVLLSPAQRWDPQRFCPS